MKPTSYKQEMGDTERLCTQEPHKFPLSFSIRHAFNKLYIYFSFLAASWHMKFLGQGSNPGHSHDLSHSCGNTRSLIHCVGPGIEPASQCAQDTANPVLLQGILQTVPIYICHVILTTILDNNTMEVV